MAARLETFFSYITKIFHRNVFPKTFNERNNPAADESFFILDRRLV